MADFSRSKRVLITGCSSGFGTHMVQTFLHGGWQVTGTSRHPERCVQGSGTALHVLHLNVSESAERKQVVEYIEETFPDGLDCLINNAGYGLVGPLESLTEDQIRQQFEVNFFAPLLLTRDLLPSLRRAHGRVINISSVLGFVGMPMQSLYAASKFALEGLSESLYLELLPHDVQVSLVEPGGFRTKFADNMEWTSEDRLSTPVYEDQMRGYRNLLKRIKERPGRDPSRVAEVVFALANKATMPLRVRVGDDTRALYYLRRLLPQQIADRVLCRISKKLLATP